VNDEKDARDASRRKFLEDAGKLAIYTPPALVALMHPSTDAVAKSVKVRSHGNNGLGQRRDDPQPRGLRDRPQNWNDKPSSIPGRPNNRKGPGRPNSRKGKR
jgi:hypothetical protein